MKKSVSIKDIAKESGVSIATVSRVINKTGRYSKETEDKVLSIIHRMNYVPNLIAKGLRVQKMMNVGIIVPDITNEFFVKLVSELENDLFQEGYQTFLCNTNEDEANEKMRAQMMTMQNVCGLIFLSTGMQDADYEGNDLPTVFIERLPGTTHRNYNLVSSDNVQGGYIATRELLDQGCRKILIMTGREHVSGYRERLQGYQKALREAGFGEDAFHICYLDRLHYSDAHQEMSRILDSGEFDYDGIFAASDWLAIGCYRALEERGYVVPDQVKLVGYDDISITAFNTVPITTIHQPVDELGRIATQQLMQALNGEQMEQQVQYVPVHLMPRASTRGDRAPKYL
ncbi:MAG: LacI family DNA-binding transcriptional regulator [Faecousia sp.]